jgi:hypothetical protein
LEKRLEQVLPEVNIKTIKLNKKKRKFTTEIRKTIFRSTPDLSITKLLSLTAGEFLIY